MNYQELMQQALMLAKEAAEHNDVPVGAVVVNQNGKVIGRGKNEREKNNDPLAHAELIEVLDLEFPEEEDESQPGGDIDLLSDLGVGQMELLAILDDTELYPDEQLEAIANRLGFGEQFNQVIESN